MFKMSSFFEKFGNKKKPPSSVLLQVKMKKKSLPPSSGLEKIGLRTRELILCGLR